jgi:hypothetical protein
LSQAGQAQADRLLERQLATGRPGTGECVGAEGSLRGGEMVIVLDLVGRLLPQRRAGVW